MSSGYEEGPNVREGRPVEGPVSGGIGDEAGGLTRGGLLGGADKDARMWGLFLHLSQLANFVVPFAGVVAPIVIWQVKKDEFPSLDRHGKNVVNWMISALIYSIAGAVLSLVIVGIFILIAVAVVSIVFPIIGGIKANNGEVWRYPLTIEFLK